MIEQLGTVLDKLEGYFGKSFLVAGFLPVALFAIAAVPLVGYLFPAAAEVFFAVWRLPATDQIPFWLMILFLLCLAGFLLNVSTGWLRLVMDGTMAPGFLKARMQKEQQEQLDALETRLNERRSELAQFRKMDSENFSWMKALAEARQAGDSLREVPKDYQLPDALREAKKKVEGIKDLGKAIPFQDMQVLFQELESVLKANPASKVPALEVAQVDFKKLKEYGLARAEAAYAVLRSERVQRFPSDPSELGPTQLANLDQVTRDYVRTRYGMDVEAIWPRLQKAVQTDEKTSAALDQAKRQLDFCVAMTWACAAYTVLAYVLLMWKSPSLMAYVLVTVGGALATSFFYRVAIPCSHIYNETLRAVVDLFRFQLLDLLHIKKPADSVEEQKIWTELSLRESFSGASDIKFEHK